MKIIGVAGQLAQGKDVLCDRLCEILNRRMTDKHQAEMMQDLWTRATFAGSVKKVYEIGFGVDLDFIEQWKRIDEPPPGFNKNVRKSLQFIGDGFRQIKDNIWIEIALRDKTKNKIFSDCRYNNEAKAIKEYNGMMILLYRPGYINDDPNPSESQIKPLVEWAKDNLKSGKINHEELNNPPEIISYYDYFFINDGSLSDLYQKIDEELAPFIEQVFQNV